MGPRPGKLSDSLLSISRSNEKNTDRMQTFQDIMTGRKTNEAVENGDR